MCNIFKLSPLPINSWAQSLEAVSRERKELNRKIQGYNFLNEHWCGIALVAINKDTDPLAPTT